MVPGAPLALLALLPLLLAPGAQGGCGPPPRLTFAELSGQANSSYPVGSQVQYSCRLGYTKAPGKSPSLTCLQNSTWSEAPEFCVPKSCRQPEEIANGRADITSLLYGATVTFSCNEGYRLIGTTSAQCVVVGSEVDWNKEAPLCDPIRCPPPPVVINGSNDAPGDEVPFGLVVTYKCDKDFSLVGNASIHCTTKDHLNGEWSGPAPECKMVKCVEPNVKNGRKTFGFGPNYSYQSAVGFECENGYTLKGSSIVKCEANSSWVPSLPTCLEITSPVSTTSPQGGINNSSGPTVKPSEGLSKNSSESTTKLREETSKTPSESTTKLREETSKTPSESTTKLREETSKTPSGSTTKPREETSKTPSGSTTKPREETSKTSSGPNTGTTIAIGKMSLVLAVLINLFIRQ